MPVSHQKKRITSTSDASTLDPSPPLLQSQQEFHAYLRSLAQRAVRTVIEAVMREELDAFIGVAWGECNPKRKGYRNGSYLRDLVTSTGRLEDIKVPRDREGHFHTQTFECYSRYELHIAEGLTQMFVAGNSTQKVGDVAQTLLGVAPSASSISRLNQTLAQQFESGRERPLQERARFPEEHLLCKGVLFLISSPFAGTLFGNRGISLSSSDQMDKLYLSRISASLFTPPLYTIFGIASKIQALALTCEHWYKLSLENRSPSGILFPRPCQLHSSSRD